MATTAEGIRYPVATDAFQPHVDVQKVAEDASDWVAALNIQAFAGMGMANSGPLTPPAGSKIIGRVGTFTGTVAGSNVLGPIVFPTPFPNGLLAVFPIVYSGVGIAAVVNGATTIGPTEFSCFITGTGGSTNVKVGYLALGW